jgi:hypothetical protein
MAAFEVDEHRHSELATGKVILLTIDSTRPVLEDL